MRLDAAAAVVERSIGGGNDLSVPTRWLSWERLDVDEIFPTADPPSGSKEMPMAVNVAEVFVGTNE